MPNRLHDLSKLEVGEPVPFDVRDAKGVLLLRKGQKVTSVTQIKSLVRQAMSYGPGLLPDHRYHAAARSPLAMVLGVRWQLQSLYADANPTEFPTTVSRLAGVLRQACRTNADVALASILMCRDEPYAIRHSVNVAIASCIAGATMKLDEAALGSTMAAALTMNIAMLGLQDLLQAFTGPLDRALRSEVESHCQRGVSLLQTRGVVDPLWLEIVRDHRERADGSGYPDGKSAGDIGVPSQLVALADIYCARVSGRIYRPAMQSNVALRWLFLNQGAAVDRRHAERFIKALGIYPPGTAVRLQNGSIGVVTQRGVSGQRPRVSSITTQDGSRTSSPIRRRDDAPEYAVAEVVDLEALGLEVSMEALWGADAAA